MKILRKESVSDLQKRSNEILDVFTRTVVDLEKVNDEIESLQESKLEMMKRLDDEVNILDEQRQKNKTTINKIKDFLS